MSLLAHSGDDDRPARRPSLRCCAGCPGCSRLTPMYGAAVRCKRFSSICWLWVSHQCIRPLIGACAPGHYGYQRAYLDTLEFRAHYACAHEERGRPDGPSSALGCHTAIRTASGAPWRGFIAGLGSAVAWPAQRGVTRQIACFLSGPKRSRHADLCRPRGTATSG